MKIKVLMDNNTYIDEYVLGEPALAFYIEHHDKKILFDTGYSAALIENAKTYQIDLNTLDYIVLSHAHNDHTRGLNFLLKECNLTNTTLIVHPDIFAPRQDEGVDIGMVNTQTELEAKMNVVYASNSFELSDGLWLITNIAEHNPFENQHPVGQKFVNNIWTDDYMTEECGLAYVGKQGLNIVAGCSHRGICNLIEQAKIDCSVHQVNTVIGGFHLFKVNALLEKTVASFKESSIKKLYPCHCVSFKAKAFLNQHFDIHEVGVGLTLDWE